MPSSYAQLIFDETPGAGVYTATVGLPRGAAVQAVNLVPLAAPWDATTALIDVGDTLTATDAYYSAYDVDALADYDPTAAVVGTNYETLVNAGNDYDPASTDWPGVVYVAGDVITAVLTTTGAGGTNGLLVVQILGVGFGSVTHRASKA